MQEICTAISLQLLTGEVNNIISLQWHLARVPLYIRQQSVLEADALEAGKMGKHKGSFMLNITYTDGTFCLFLCKFSENMDMDEMEQYHWKSWGQYS